MELVAEGDENAFRFLFESYSDRVFGVALAYTRVPQMAEEVVQDIFLKLWTRRSELPSISKLESYIFIIARNHILNLLRNIAREKAMLQEHRHQWEDVHAAAAETVYMHKQSQQVFEEALLRLPPQQRTVFMLHRKHGLRLHEVADRLSLSRNTVRNHLARAMASIREYAKLHGLDITLLLLAAEKYFE